MVQVQLVTVDSCDTDSRCKYCALAESVLRLVVESAGIRLPDHNEAGRGELHLADGRLVEAVHLACGDVVGMDAEHAPYLVVDGKIVMEGDDWAPDAMARTVLEALFPDGPWDLQR